MSHKMKTKSHAKKELSPEDRIKNSRQLKVVDEWLKSAYPDFSAEMSTGRNKSHNFVLQIFQVFDFLNYSSFSRFKYEGSDPDSVAESALADLKGIAKNDRRRPDPYKALCGYVKENYKGSKFKVYEQTYGPNMKEDTHPEKKFHVIVGDLKELGKGKELEKHEPKKYHYVLANNSGINYQQAADRVLIELKIKDKFDIDTNNLIHNYIDKEVLKKINDLFDEIMSKNAKGNEKTFFISALLMTHTGGKA